MAIPPATANRTPSIAVTQDDSIGVDAMAAPSTTCVTLPEDDVLKLSPLYMAVITCDPSVKLDV